MSERGLWANIAVVRARDIRARIGFSLFVGVAAWGVAPSIWPLVWTAVTIAVQLGTLLVSEPFRREAGRGISRRRKQAFFAAVAASSAVFASIAPYCWFAGGWGGRIFAIMMLAGGALNVALQARAWAAMLWFGAAPFLVLLPTLPLLSLIFEKDAPPTPMAITAGAGLLFVVHLAATGRRTATEAAALASALAEARRDRRLAEEASSAKSDFLGVISHEIRTPLNGVLGMAQAMAGDRLTAVQKRRLRVLRDSGESLLGLLNDVLDLSEVAAGKLELQAGRVDPAVLAAEAETAFAALAQAKGVALEVRVDGSHAASRAGDAARVRQILHHLVANALKFTESGQVRVRIGGSEAALLIEVADTGCGMEPERLATLFERFSQGDASPTRRHGGAGVGLPLCQGLARLMGGEISASSAPGEGSVFTARLPLPTTLMAADAPPRELARRDIAPGPHPADPPERVLRILAAEDNATNRMVLQLLLDEVGLSAHMVENGQEAVEAWRDAHWDLILMDIQMPLMDGVAATRAIRQAEREEGRPRTPIVALTANAMSHQAAEYVAAGMDGLVPKPIEFGKLIAVIANAGDLGEPGEEGDARVA